MHVLIPKSVFGSRELCMLIIKDLSTNVQSVYVQVTRMARLPFPRIFNYQTHVYVRCGLQLAMDWK